MDNQSITIRINNKNFFANGSGQYVMIPRHGISDGDEFLFFPVFNGTSNAMVFANWTVRSDNAMVTLIIDDCEEERLYEEDFVVEDSITVNVVLNEFDNFGEDYTMEIWAYYGNIEFTNEVAVCY